MQKKLLISAVLGLIFIGGAVIVWEKKGSQVMNQKPEQTQVDVRSREDSKVFVTDVDPEVSHWQTKETKYMTVKFPKEWYWVEISVEKPGSNGAFVISNNKDFPLEDYKNDSFNMTGIQNSTLDNTEVVITVWGSATSDAGTPLDSLDSRIDSAENFDPTAKCIRPSNTVTLPIVASCSTKQGNHQVEHKYYVIDEINSLIITARTTDETLVSKDIIERIARNIKIKY